MLDNVTGVWLPDVAKCYGKENLSNLGLDNTQTLMHEQRLMITDSEFYPQCYKISKVVELLPRGIIKLTLKQDEYNEKRDNVDLHICDYYLEEGNLIINIEEPEDEEGSSTIYWRELNEDGELELVQYDEGFDLERGKVSYFEVEFSDEGIDPEWRIELINDNEEYSEDDVKYYNGLISVTEFDDLTVAIKPAKAGSLSGKEFRLSVSDIHGNYYSSIDLEVM